MSYAWWQTLILIANNSLLAGGVFGLLAALFYAIRGRPYHPGRHPLWVALGSLAALALGLFGLNWTRTWTSLPHGSDPGFF